jgi:SEC-C motif-containing protein
MENCPCGSGLEFGECCGPILAGREEAATAEALLRARYTAHVKLQMDFVRETTHPEQQPKFEPTTARQWAEKSEWEQLEIVAIKDGGEGDETGEIEFIAHYRQKDKPKTHHEMALFKRYDEKWYFYDGQGVLPKTVIRDQPKIGRNEPCPCGSGKKYKKCCGR